MHDYNPHPEEESKKKEKGREKRIRKQVVPLGDLRTKLEKWKFKLLAWKLCLLASLNKIRYLWNHPTCQVGASIHLLSLTF